MLRLAIVPMLRSKGPGCSLQVRHKANAQKHHRAFRCHPFCDVRVQIFIDYQNIFVPAVRQIQLLAVIRTDHQLCYLIDKNFQSEITSMLFKDVSKGKVKEVLEKNGWSSRNCSWTDYELTNDWSELVLEGDDDEPLLNGAIVFVDKSIEILDKTFKTLGGYFVYEFYDDNKSLFLEKRNNS